MSDLLYFLLYLLFLAIWQRIGLLLVKTILSSGSQILQQLWPDVLEEFYPEVEGGVAV